MPPDLAREAIIYKIKTILLLWQVLSKSVTQAPLGYRGILRMHSNCLEMHTKNVLQIAVSSVPEHVILTSLEASGSEERCWILCWAACHRKRNQQGCREQEPQETKTGSSLTTSEPRVGHPSRQGTGETASEHPAGWEGLLPTGI